MTTVGAAELANVPELLHLIGGEWVAGEGEIRWDESPAQPGTPISFFRELSSSQLDAALRSSSDARASWRRLPMHQRAEVLRRAASLLTERSESLARDISREQGKNIAVSTGEVARAAAIFDYFAHDANSSTGSLFNSVREHERIFTHRVPLGSVLTITPWNVPLVIPAWKIAPALVHGNTVVWKPSEYTSVVATRLAQILTDAGLPAGVCNLILGAGGQTAETALKDQRISGCTFTGSTTVGLHVVGLGTSLGTPVLAEMGGNNAAIVLADADLDWAVGQIVAASMGWSGQRCTATRRVLVVEEVYDLFLAKLVEAVKVLRVGDPMDTSVDLGPVTTRRQVEHVAQVIENARVEGAQVVVGGVPEADPTAGYYVMPTVLTDVSPDSALFHEEVFGPLVSILRVADYREALALANDSKFGLSGAVFSQDLDRVLEAVEEFEVGVLHINSETCGADTHVPFGGFKDSGTPHKEMGVEARDFFTRQKTVYLRRAES